MHVHHMETFTLSCYIYIHRFALRSQPTQLTHTIDSTFSQFSYTHTFYLAVIPFAVVDTNQVVKIMERREVTEETSLVVNESENPIPKRQSRLDTCKVSPCLVTSSSYNNQCSKSCLLPNFKTHLIHMRSHHSSLV